MTSNRSFTGDLLESFRWIADVTAMDTFESGVLDLPDFYFTGDDYRYRFEPEAKQRFLDLLRERFNSGVRYKGRALKWDTVIEHKVVELGKFLLDCRTVTDFLEPSPGLHTFDGRELRERIISLCPSRARALGIGKSSLCYLRKRAIAGRPFGVHRKLLAKIQRI